MDYRVKYFTEFGMSESVIEESRLVSFIYRFKVFSIKAEIKSKDDKNTKNGRHKN